MTTITIRTSLLRKIAPYVLFLFTVLSFFFTTPFLLYLFISLATLGFIFVNTTQLFSRERYLSYIEIFASILLLVRLIMIYSHGLFYQIIIYFVLVNFVLFYILHFTNIRTEDTNVLGIRKEGEYSSRKRINKDEEFEEDNELDGLLPDDEPLEDEDQLQDDEESPEDALLENEEPEEEQEVEEEGIEQEIKKKPKQKKSKVTVPKKPSKRKK